MYFNMVDCYVHENYFYMHVSKYTYYESPNGTTLFPVEKKRVRLNISGRLRFCMNFTLCIVNCLFHSVFLYIV